MYKGKMESASWGGRIQIESLEKGRSVIVRGDKEAQLGLSIWTTNQADWPD